MPKNKELFSGKLKERVETVETIIKDNNFNKSGIKSIKSKINAEIKKWTEKGEVGELYDLALAGYSYLKYTLEYQEYDGRQKAKEGQKAFDEIFFDVFESDKDFEIFVCSFTLKFMGLEDLSSYSHSKNVDNAKKEASTKGKTLDLGSIVELELGVKKNELEDKISEYSRLNIPLLIVGETGTSKGLLAKAIHKMSKRRKAPYREINCTAIPRNLIESELFGHKKGAFTGADNDKKGIIEEVKHGTLLLDELGKMPNFMQVKLLKIIEDKEVYPIGGNKPVKIDVRFLATLQPNEISELNRDLLYRFRWPIHIEMPTLSDRLKTLQYSIIENSLGRVLEDMNIKNFKISHDACDKLINRQTYPGNYREFENILLLSVLSAKAEGRDEILPKNISFNNTFNDRKTVNVNDIRLRDIVKYADKEASELCASIINEKIDQLKGQGKDIKNTLISEGLPEKQYPNFMKHTNRRLGKVKKK